MVLKGKHERETVAFKTRHLSYTLTKVDRRAKSNTNVLEGLTFYELWLCMCA